MTDDSDDGVDVVTATDHAEGRGGTQETTRA